MSRDLTTDFNLANNAAGADTRDLYDFTLLDGSMFYISTGRITIGAIVYQADIREPGEWRYSQGGNTDGIRLGVENASGTYGFSDADALSPLDGVGVVFKRAVSRPGANAWQVDIIGYGKVRGLEIDGEIVRLSIVADTNDPANLMSGEQVTLEELTPVAAEVGGGTTTTPTPVDDTGGFGPGRFFNPRESPFLDRDFRLIQV